MKSIFAMAFAISTAFAASFALAKEASRAEQTYATMLAAQSARALGLSPAAQTYREIEATRGSVPIHFRAYPKSAVAGAWALSKGLEAGAENVLEPKVKSLINLAVAAQIPCRYCIWLETKMAKDRGATDEEIAEAVAHAGYVRHWSAVLNGLQIDLETFKAEFGGE